METYILTMIAIALVSALFYNSKTRELKIVLYDLVKLGGIVIVSFIAITLVMETSLLHIELVIKLFLTYCYFITLGWMFNYALRPQS